MAAVVWRIFVIHLLPGTVMVIRGDELVTDREFIEETTLIEIRNVISVV